MNRFFRCFALAAWLLPGFVVSSSVSAADGSIATLPAMSEAETARIKLIVKDAIREYAASLNERHGNEDARDIVREITQGNRNFMRTHGPNHFKPLLDGQRPRATVVTCADSRVHTHALDGTPDGDLFVVRNIGNQIATAEGSVEYGVHHLHTPLLLIVGHVACGAIKAAAGDYAEESAAIRRELDTLQVPKGEPGLASVKLNVNHQVRQAMAKFEQEVVGGSLTVVGAVYDFRNEMKQGQGKLNFINVNGETDPAKLVRLDLLQIADGKPGTRPRRQSMPAKAPEH